MGLFSAFFFFSPHCTLQKPHWLSLLQILLEFILFSSFKSKPDNKTKKCLTKNIFVKQAALWISYWRVWPCICLNSGNQLTAVSHPAPSVHALALIFANSLSQNVAIIPLTLSRNYTQTTVNTFLCGQNVPAHIISAWNKQKKKGTSLQWKITKSQTTESQSLHVFTKKCFIHRTLCEMSAKNRIKYLRNYRYKTDNKNAFFSVNTRLIKAKQSSHYKQILSLKLSSYTS